jgi:peptide/nickel transport system permease protein
MIEAEAVSQGAAPRPWQLLGSGPSLTALLPLGIVGLVAIVGLFGPFMVPHDPFALSLGATFKPPVWAAGGSWSYPLGTDSLGRDILSRLIFGARVTLLVSLTAICLGGVLGSIIGLLAGFLGGWVDVVLMRAADATLAFPIIFAGLLLAITLGPSFLTVVIAIVIVIWARFARVIRGEVLSLREREFVALARIGGCSTWRILTKHLLPNVLNTFLVMVTLQVGLAIVIESSLSFLGAGIPPPAPTWGSMVAEGRNEIAAAWWISTFPGLAILLTVVAWNLLGDWLRDALDPKLRQL